MPAGITKAVVLTGGQTAENQEYMRLSLFDENGDPLNLVGGAQGPRGLQGIPGPVGDTGAKGDKGDKGDTGSPGAKGDIGPQGPQGPIGLTGQGAPGPQGLRGDIGVPGPQGPKGDTGDTGLAGPAGIQGPAGPKGDTGLQGAKGDTGLPGSTGSAGSVGPQGPKGDTGAPGAASTVPGPQGPAGEAAGPIPLPPLWAPLFPYSAYSTGALAAGQIRVTRVYIAGTIWNAAFEVTTLGATNVVLCAFRDNVGDHTPYQYYSESSPIDCSSIGMKSGMLNVNGPGWFWVGVLNTGSAAVTLRTGQGINPHLPGTTMPATPWSPTTVMNFWNVAGVGGSVPSNFPLGGTITYVVGPAIFLGS